MRSDLVAFDPTEPEFRQIFEIRKALSDKVSELQMRVNIDPSSPPNGLQIAAASKQAEQNIAALLDQSGMLITNGRKTRFL
jgi:hypothetical protein